MSANEIDLLLELEKELRIYERLRKRQAEIGKNELLMKSKSPASPESSIEELRKRNLELKEISNELLAKIPKAREEIIHKIRNITAAMSSEDKKSIIERIREEEEHKKISKYAVQKKVTSLKEQEEKKGDKSKINRQRQALQIQLSGASPQVVETTLETWLKSEAMRLLIRNAINSRTELFFGVSNPVQESLEMASPKVSPQASESPISEIATTPKITPIPFSAPSEKNFISTNSNVPPQVASTPSSFSTKGKGFSGSGIASTPKSFAKKRSETTESKSSWSGKFSSFFANKTPTKLSTSSKDETPATPKQEVLPTPKETTAPIKYRIDTIDNLAELMSRSSSSTSEPACLAKKNIIYIQLGQNPQDRAQYAILGADGKLIQKDLPKKLTMEFTIRGGSQKLIKEIINMTPELNPVLDTLKWDEELFSEPTINFGEQPTIPADVRESLTNPRVQGLPQEKKRREPKQKAEPAQEPESAQTPTFTPATPSNIPKTSLPAPLIITGFHKQQLQNLKAEQEQEQNLEEDKSSPHSPS